MCIDHLWMVSADISPYTVVCQSQPGGNVFQCFGGRPIQADRFSIFFFALSGHPFPLRGLYHTLSVCQLRFMFVQVLSECLGMEPELFGGVGYRAGVFSQAPDGFLVFGGYGFIRFSISANQDPLLPCWKVLPVPSLSRYAICADKNEVLPP